MKPATRKSIVILLVSSLLALAYVYLNTLKEPIKIGFSGGLTGATSELGVTGRNGALLAVEDINEAGGVNGRKIELLIADDKNDPQEALVVDKALAAQGVKAIIGHFTSGMAQLTVPYVNEHNMLLLSPTISTDELSGLEDNFLRVVPANSLQGMCLAKTAVHLAKVKNIAVVYDGRNSLFAKNLISSFTERVREFGGQVVCTKEYVPLQQGNMADELKKCGADGILVIAASSDAAMICQQLRKNMVDIPVFLPMWAMTHDLIKQGGMAVENVYLTNLEDFSSTDPDYMMFKARYHEKYGQAPTFSSMLAYNAVQVLAEAMRTAPNLTSPQIKAEIIRRRSFKVLQGSIEIDKFGDTKGKYYPYIVKDGVFRRTVPE